MLPAHALKPSQNLLCRRAILLPRFTSGLCTVGDPSWTGRRFTTRGLLTSNGVKSGYAWLSSGPRSVGWSSLRRLSRSVCAPQDAAAQVPPREGEQALYHGPLAQTFRRLKIFSLASLGLTFTMTPFLFIVESSLPASARIFLTATALSTSSISTALVGWCGAPYVIDLRRLTPDENDGIEGIEMTTLTLTLKKLTTRVYDADFLVETRRPFAKWELPLSVQLPPPDEDVASAGKASIIPGKEETVAETFNEKGKIIGRWIVKWGEGGTGTCRGAGKTLR